MPDTNQKVFVKNCDDEISIWMEKNHFFGDNPEESLRGMSFYEFSLDELGLPSAEELLENINTVRNKIGLKGWKSKGAWTGVSVSEYREGNTACTSVAPR